MPGTRGIASLAGAAVIAILLAGCGGDEGGEKIPSDDAEQMLTLASEIDAATASGECDVAQSSTTELSHMVEALPEATDPAIVEGLNAMVSRIDEQLDEECTETGTSDVTTTKPETTTTPTTTTPTTTTTTTTEPPDEEEEPPEQPPGEGGGPQGPPETPPGQSGGGPPTGGTEEEFE